jgi:hypothetical protein
LHVGTGLIVAFVVAIWAAYFVPLVLRRYDEASTSSSLETLSPLSRVITRPMATALDDSGDAETPEPTPAVDEPSAEVEAGPERAPRPMETRSAARLAARRRRRTLLTLLTATAIVGGLVGLRVVPVWSVAIPVGLVLAWLVACRVQVRHERGISRPRVPTTTKSAASGSKDAESTVIVSGQVEDVNPARQHVMESTPLEADALDEQLVIAAPSVATTGELVWDPLPVTLPTYVTKPRAGRTVRTIDFAQPGAWTSGHVEGEDVELPSREHSREPSRDQASSDVPRRAAGQ